MQFGEDRRQKQNPRRDGTIDRRAEYCPVHDIKCDEWKATEKKVSSRVPIWVFMIFISLVAAMLGYLNKTAIDSQSKLMETLNLHIKESNVIFNRIGHATAEGSINQKIVMEHLELKYKKVPFYDDH